MLAAAFAATQLVVLLSDADVWNRVPVTLHHRYSNAGLRHQLYAGLADPSKNILACCGASPPSDPEMRLEKMFPEVLARAPDGVEWFIFTAGDTWWHMPNLVYELHRIETAVAPAKPMRDILVVGGGGYVIFSSFMILSKPAVAFLSNQTTLSGCRDGLRVCRSYEHRMPNEFAQMRAIGCHHNGPGTGRMDGTYQAKELVNYCVASPLATGKCGPHGFACEWRFGRIARDADLEDPKALFALAKAGGPRMPNEMARRRYRQNPSRGSLRLGAREVTPGMAPECEPVLCDLVAFEHADNYTQAWLESMVDTQGREKCCKRPENG